MSVMKVVKIGDEVLRSKAVEVTVFDDSLRSLLLDMRETMLYNDGVGLAAPQVGISKRIIVVSVDHKKFYDMVNPKILYSTGEETALEGCLSVPNKHAEVVRPTKIYVEGYDGKGKKYKIKPTGYLARAFCHEIDHLDGILYIDRALGSVVEGE